MLSIVTLTMKQSKSRETISCTLTRYFDNVRSVGIISEKGTYGFLFFSSQ